MTRPQDESLKQRSTASAEAQLSELINEVAGTANVEAKALRLCTTDLGHGDFEQDQSFYEGFKAGAASQAPLREALEYALNVMESDGHVHALGKIRAILNPPVEKAEE